MTNIDSSENFNKEQTFQGALGGALGGAFRGAVDYSLSNGGINEVSGITSFKEELEKFISNDGTTPVSDIIADMDICAFQNLETANIDKADAMFFINMVNQAGITNYTVSDNGNLINALDYRGIEVSKTLSDMLLKAKETKQAIRLDFDNNVTVILKLDDSGKLNAHFIPGDKAVEEYLKNNIPYLKQRFDEQNIPYANLSYKQHKQRENNGQNNKEKRNNE